MLLKSCELHDDAVLCQGSIAEGMNKQPSKFHSIADTR
jgi:hypothetical protein